MKNENYITIQGWMINVLKLKGNELVLFSIIYGFSQDNNSEYKGSINYISNSLQISKRSAVNLINRLVDKNYIIKIEDESGNRFKYNYDLINNLLGSAKNAQEVVQKMHRGSAKNAQTGSAKSAYNNILNNNNTNNNINKKKLFRNSIYSNYEEVKKYMLSKKELIDKYKGADLRYYIEAVEIWTDKNDIKRTDKGWMSTIRGFMLSDIKKNELKKIKTVSSVKNSVIEKTKKYD